MCPTASSTPQDAGPLAHPIRPDSYIKMDNFYTVTVYEKGAEVIRLYRTLLGKDGFRKGEGGGEVCRGGATMRRGRAGGGQG